MDREGKDPIDLMDEVENVLDIQCSPMTWPIGMGKNFKGVFHLYSDTIHVYSPTHGGKINEGEVIQGLDNQLFGDLIDDFREEIELVRGASHAFNLELFLQGKLTPVYFGSAINNFGLKELLDALSEFAPAPQPRASKTRVVEPIEDKFSGFVFKIQANMDPHHSARLFGFL